MDSRTRNPRPFPRLGGAVPADTFLGSSSCSRATFEVDILLLMSVTVVFSPKRGRQDLGVSFSYRISKTEIVQLGVSIEARLDDFDIFGLYVREIYLVEHIPLEECIESFRSFG